jgi:hypothetical protein
MTAMVLVEAKRPLLRLYGIADFSGQTSEVPVAAEDDYPYFFVH